MRDKQTPWLIWQLLTKRPENVAALTPWAEAWPANVWLGTSVEDNQRAAERIPVLLRINAKTRFLSCEPLLEDVDLRPWFNGEHAVAERRPDWVIVGGESGSRARPMHPDWARSLRDQCQVAGVAFFFKQWGSWSPMPRPGGDGLMVLTGSRDVANDGTVYRPGDLTYDPPGPRYREAIRAGHDRAALTAMYPASKKSSRELDGRIWDEFPTPAGVP